MVENKKIIVTGASGGIGNSIVEKLYNNGADILATGTRDEKLNELKQKFKNIKTLKFDISDHNKIEEFLNTATEDLGGSLDCIVNNAGITKDNLTIRMSMEEWTKVIDINVNCISPGFISTAMTDKIDYKFKETIISKIPANRLGMPEDIANAVLFLASNNSDYINGETLHVNGGLYLG